MLILTQPWPVLTQPSCMACAVCSGGGRRSPQDKGMYFPLPQVTPQPALWGFLDVHQQCNWCWEANIIPSGPEEVGIQ